MTGTPLTQDYFHSMRAHYEIIVPRNMAQATGLIKFVEDFKKAISEHPSLRKPASVEARWEGQEYQGRDLILFNPNLPNNPYQNYALLEFDKDEKLFYVRDSSRQGLTREAVCNILDNLPNIYPQHPAK